MPRYIIERTYLMPVYKQFVVEAPDAETACREAMDEHKYDWDGQIDNPECSRPHHLTRIVQVADDEVPDLAALYDRDHEALDIPREFTEPDAALLAEILERNDRGKDRVPIDGEDLARLRLLAGIPDAQAARS
jgi:hypothetical protein